MNGYGRIYVIDNNALSVVKREHRASDFFKQHCRIPSEVLHEAEGFPDIEELKHLEYPITRSVLAVLTEVLASVPIGTRSSWIYTPTSATPTRWSSPARWTASALTPTSCLRRRGPWSQVTRPCRPRRESSDSR